MASKTGEVREMLISAMEQLCAGKMTAADASALAKLGSQVNESLKVELLAMTQLRNMRLEAPMLPDPEVGVLSLGEELPKAPR